MRYPLTYHFPFIARKQANVLQYSRGSGKIETVHLPCRTLTYAPLLSTSLGHRGSELSVVVSSRMSVLRK